MRVFLLLLCLLLPAHAGAAAINHAYTEVATVQTTASTTYVDVPGASIASSEFTAGKKYLLVVDAQFRNDTATAQASLQVVHGSTAFGESAITHQFSAAPTTPVRNGYRFVTVWTAVAGEGITAQFKASANTAECNFVTLFKLTLSDDLTENTDWFSAESATDATITTAGVAGASVSFTPAAGNDWLVLSYAQVDITSTSSS